MAKLQKLHGEYILKDYKLSLTNDMYLETGKALEVNVKLVEQQGNNG